MEQLKQLLTEAKVPDILIQKYNLHKLLISKYYIIFNFWLVFKVIP